MQDAEFFVEAQIGDHRFIILSDDSEHSRDIEANRLIDVLHSWTEEFSEEGYTVDDMMEMLEALHGLHRLYDVDKVVNSPRFSSTSSDTENGWTP